MWNPIETFSRVYPWEEHSGGVAAQRGKVFDDWAIELKNGGL